MKKAVILFLVLTSFFVNGQTDTYTKTPLTPNAASLGDYASMPIGLYTGTAQYSIPLYTVQGRNLSVPITLNYSTNGVKVENITSWVGTGWSLDAGGVITREVKDKRDDKSIDVPPVIANAQCLDFSTSQIIEESVNDLEYDRFSYNFMGNSGSFIIVNDVVKLLDNDGLKFDNTNNNLNEFVVTDTQGIKYYFGQQVGLVIPIEETITESEEPIKTAWYLTKIVHWSGETIQFEYMSDYQAAPYHVGYNQTRTKDLVTDDVCAMCPPQTHYWSPVSGLNSSKFRHKNVYLTKIYCTNLYDSAEFLGGSTLTEIKGVTKRIKFDIIKPTSYRHYLKQVTFQSLNEKNEKKYKFDYFDESNVPTRETFSRDVWGYYNGRNNINLIQGDHKANPAVVANGALTKITFPTGGYSIINYESNGITNPTGCLSEVELPPIETISWHYGGDEGTYEMADPYSFTIPSVQDVTFTLMQEYFPNPRPNVTGVTAGNAYFSVTYPDGSIHNFPQPSFDNGSRQLTLHLLPGTYTFNLTVKSSIYRALYSFNICNQIGNVLQNFGGIRVKKIDSYASNGTLSLSKGYEYWQPKMATPKRFSTIYILQELSASFCFDPSANNNVLPSFQPYCIKYMESSTGPSDNSSAVGDAFYGEVTENFIGGSDGNYAITHTFNDAAMRSIPMPIITDEMPDNTVTEYFGKPFEMETRYYKITDTNQKYLVKKEQFNYGVTPEGSPIPSYIRSKRTHGIFAYNFSWPAGTTCISDFFILNRKMKIARYFYIPFWQKLNSTVQTEYIYNSTNNLVGEIKNQTNNFYQNATHRQITKQETFLSETIPGGTTGKKETLVYSYPDDIQSIYSLSGGIIPTDNYNAIVNMKSANRHMISTPLQIEKLDNTGAHIETKRTLYKLDATTNFPLPEKEQYLKGEASANNVLKDKQSYSNYNLINLKPQQVLVNPNNTPTCYIYGYDNRYPIAIIKNKYYDSVIDGIATSIPTHTSDGDIQSLYTQLSAIPNILFTVYGYSKLIGVSKIIDSNGQQTTYNYDVFNRLRAVKDHQGNIITENQYNYRPQ